MLLIEAIADNVFNRLLFKTFISHTYIHTFIKVMELDDVSLRDAELALNIKRGKTPLCQSSVNHF